MFAIGLALDIRVSNKLLYSPHKSSSINMYTFLIVMIIAMQRLIWHVIVIGLERMVRKVNRVDERS